jgi:DNA-binding CsgD family transcriptional regulator
VRSLQAIGISALAESAYLTLVEHGPATGADLAGLLGSPSPQELDRALDQLRGLGLLEQQSAGGANGPLTARAPRAPLESLAEERARQAAALRESADALSQVWRDRHRADAGYVEIVRTAAASRLAIRRITEEATALVRQLSVGPSSPVDRTPEVAPGAFGALARGVEFRVVYSAGILLDPVARQVVNSCVEQGEQARVFPDVALNLMICDDRLAALAIPRPGGRPHHTMLVRPSGLLDGLVGVFESYWRMGVPLPARGEVVGGGTQPSDEERQLLSYLSAGRTDESIARELGVSDRTVSRRIARLQEVLGAQTRFQLGVQAGRQGWL